MNLEKEFIPHTEALELKELGFDEPCLGFYDGKGDTKLYFNNLRDASGDFKPFIRNERLTWFGVPTFSQAFRWFREKYDLRVWFPSKNPISFDYTIATSNDFFKNYEFENDEFFVKQEEAEIACLKKLIEIVKEK